MINKKTASDTATPSFETAMQDLEKLVTQLEQGQLPLDESVRLFQQGMETAKHCHQQLLDAQQLVETISSDNTLLDEAKIDKN